MLPIRQRFVFGCGRRRWRDCRVRGLALRRRHRGGLLQAEFQQRFARYFDLLAPREHLYAGASRRPYSCANRRAFSAAGDGADDGSEDRPASHFLRSVRPAALSLQAVVAADQRIIMAIDDDADELQLQLRAAGKMAGFLHFCKTAVNVRALARDERVLVVKVGLKAAVENITNLIFAGIHPIDHAHQERLSSRDGDFAILSGGVLRSMSLWRQGRWLGSWGRNVLRNYRRWLCL